jgi:phage shock protein A
MFRAIKRVFIWLGLMAEKATENDAVNAAVVERGIRDAKARADKAAYANGQLAAQSALLKEQVKKQQRQKEELEGLLRAAAAANDEDNGAHYAEELAQMEQDVADNASQLESLETLYKQNNEIIAGSLREVQKFEREFQQTKARVAVSRQLESLSGLMKSSVSELQGMLGSDMAQSMQQLRESAAAGEGQMRATMDLAKEMGSGIARQQEMRKARGKHLFDQYKQKMGMVQPEAQPQAQAAPPERQKIAE